MNEMENFEELGAGDSHYKAYVGPPKKYDLMGAMQFNLLTSFGLRDYHKLLDIGCGSLRSGKMLIPFFSPGLPHSSGYRVPFFLFNHVLTSE